MYCVLTYIIYDIPTYVEFWKYNTVIVEQSYWLDDSDFD